MCRTNPKCKLSTKFFFIIYTKISFEQNILSLYLCSFVCRQQGHNMGRYDLSSVKHKNETIILPEEKKNVG